MTIEERLNNLYDLRLCMTYIGDKTPNMALFKRDIINNNDIAKLELLEAASVVVKSEYEAKEKLAARVTGYKAIDDLLLEALAEQAEGRPEKLAEYLVLRQQVKDENPLE